MAAEASEAISGHRGRPVPPEDHKEPKGSKAAVGKERKVLKGSKAVDCRVPKGSKAAEDRAHRARRARREIKGLQAPKEP